MPRMRKMQDFVDGPHTILQPVTEEDRQQFLLSLPAFGRCKVCGYEGRLPDVHECPRCHVKGNG